MRKNRNNNSNSMTFSAILAFSGLFLIFLIIPSFFDRRPFMHKKNREEVILVKLWARRKNKDIRPEYLPLPLPLFVIHFTPPPTPTTKFHACMSN